MRNRQSNINSCCSGTHSVHSDAAFSASMRSTRIFARIARLDGWYEPRHAPSMPTFRATFVLSALLRGRRRKIWGFSIRRPCKRFVGLPLMVSTSVTRAIRSHQMDVPGFAHFPLLPNAMRGQSSQRCESLSRDSCKCHTVCRHSRTANPSPEHRFRFRHRRSHRE